MAARRMVMGTVTTLLAIAASSCSVFAGQAPYQEGRKVGQVQSPLIAEASGLVVSRRQPGVLWVHNDSGDAPRVYAINPKGDLLAAFVVSGAQARDWEDIAIGPGPDPSTDYLYLGDIGDNNGRHPSVVVYRVKEPAVDPNRRGLEGRTDPADSISLVYPDGPRDAEALLVDPLTRDIYVISKRDLFSRVYGAKDPLSLSQTNKLELVCLLPWGVATGGDVSPDGKKVIVRSMYWASLWDRDPNKPLWQAFRGTAWTIPLAAEPQGEAIGFDSRGRGYYTISEGKNPSITYFAPAETGQTSEAIDRHP